jgi:acid stress chaperone HdeB
MKRYLSIAIAASVTLASQAMAAEIDMSKMTCKQVAAMEPGKIIAVGMWMSGFAAGKANNMMVDTEKMSANADKLGDYCSKNPDATLATVMEQMSKM